MKNTIFPILLCPLVLLCGCMSTPSKKAPLKTVDHVDLSRFMGDWYVIGTIPWIVEKNNVGTMDIYKMRPDGRIDITYVFHKKDLLAKRQEMHAIGTVLDTKTNAKWGVQFLWPFKAPYLVIDLAHDYSTTTIGYPSRDLIWIMARTPTLPEGTYQELLQKASSQGYDLSRIVKVPQKTGM
ncbi:MAG: lipocalin family protein [Verrucomicrobia bacterium]|nr:MAG: lipocalin family protein [Verrucomicrobiota bacterium]